MKARAGALLALASALALVALLPVSCGDSGTPPASQKDGATDSPYTGDSSMCSHCGTQACCNGVCTDTSSDDNNCGTCGNQCLPGSAPDCMLGVCGCTGNNGTACGAGDTCCTNGCMNLMTDSKNCGACGKSCTAGQGCNNGQCSCGGTTCTGTQICCSNACVDKNNDNNNCGACGNQCTNGNTCQNGLCQGGQNQCNGVTCPVGQQCCPDVCCSMCTGGVCMDNIFGDGGL